MNSRTKVSVRWNRTLPIFMVLVVLSTGSSLIIDSAGGESLTVTDETGDVMRTGFVDVEIGGYSNIDIVSLRSTETIGDMTIVMGCADDISTEIGYMYTISVSGIHISLQEGTFEVWRIGTDLQTVDNVQTGFANSEITVIVSKAAIFGDVVLNGTANYFAFDPSIGATSENYYDLVGDIDGRTRAMGDFTIDFDDDTDDVRVIYLDEEPVDEDGMDLSSITLEEDGGTGLLITLVDQPIFNEKVEYIVYIGPERIIWKSGSAIYHPVNDDEVDVETSVQGETIKLELPRALENVDLGSVIVRSIWTIDDSTFIEDLLPDDPYSISELLPFPPGYKRELDLRMISPGNVVMERKYWGFHPQAREDIRASIDTDDDGTVEEQETEYFVESLIEDILSSGHGSDLLFDGNAGDMELSVLAHGLSGPVDSSMDLQITVSMNFTFDVGSDADNLYEVDIEYIYPGIMRSARMEDDEVQYIVSLSLPEGWEIEPLDLEPAELSNHIAPGGAELEYIMEGRDARDFDPGSISFSVRKSTSGGDDEDITSETGDDLTWLYVVILVIMLGIMIGAILWYRRED